MAALLTKDAVLAKAVLSDKRIAEYISSVAFLSALSDDVLWSASDGCRTGVLPRLADLEALDLLQSCQSWHWLRGPEGVAQLLSDDSLLPLLQVPALRRELRHCRFCNAELLDSLSPFPRLLDELLSGWFGGNLDD